MNKYIKYIEYIKNINGALIVEWFDEDWEPIGPDIRNEMQLCGIIKIEDGIITLS